MVSDPLSVWLECNVMVVESCHIKILFVCLLVNKKISLFHWHIFLQESADAYLEAFQTDSVGKQETWTLSICNCIFQFCSFVFFLHWPYVNRLTGNICCKKEILPFPVHFPLHWLPEGFFIKSPNWKHTPNFCLIPDMRSPLVFNLHLLGNMDYQSSISRCQFY